MEPICIAEMVPSHSENAHFELCNSFQCIIHRWTLISDYPLGIQKHQLANLQVDTYYSIQIAAVTSKGAGEYSDAAVIKTRGPGETMAQYTVFNIANLVITATTNFCIQAFIDEFDHTLRYTHLQLIVKF